jgi:hypothetical protein
VKPALPILAPAHCLARTGSTIISDDPVGGCEYAEDGAHRCNRPLRHDDGRTLPPIPDADAATPDWFEVGTVDEVDTIAVDGNWTTALHAADHQCRCGSIWTCLTGSVLNPNWPKTAPAEFER